ncbi:16603_t:CDS:2 [Gigaspora margarita]|uniref:16603_t:CDS:1 n=1 Tax=Gigaspora margarita TaxID=4874 RepID=A0ABN7UWF9_GIGMA|nr:16603_t:CDS:2 [Gigaspora margarita]
MEPSGINQESDNQSSEIQIKSSGINQESDISNNQSSEIQIESSGINQEFDISDNQSTEIQIESDASYIQCFTPCCPTHKIKIQNCPLKEDLFIYHIIDFSIFYSDPNNININYAQGRNSQDPYGSPLSITNISCIARYMSVSTFDNFSCTEYIQNSPEVDKYWIFSPFKYANRTDLYDNNITEDDNNPFQINSRNAATQKLSRNTVIQDLILNITANESSHGLLPGYFGIIGNFIFIDQQVDITHQVKVKSMKVNPRIYRIPQGHFVISEFTIRIRASSSLYFGQLGLYSEQVTFLDIETKSSLQIINGTYTLLNLSPSFKYDFIRRHKLLEVEIPFVEPLKEIKDDPSNLAKKIVKRLNMIEELLRDYYIDTSYFEKIKRITDKYK